MERAGEGGEGGDGREKEEGADMRGGAWREGWVVEGYFQGKGKPVLSRRRSVIPPPPLPTLPPMSCKNVHMYWGGREIVYCAVCILCVCIVYV